MAYEELPGEEGKCPKCGKGLEYTGCSDIVDHSVAYPVKCPACGFEGTEWGKITFDCFSTDTDAGSEVSSGGAG